MKGLGILVITITLALGAWWMMKSADSSAATAEGPSPNAAMNAAKRAESRERASAINRQAVAFKNEKGNWPKDLEELRSAGYIERVPDDVDYDPASGACTARP